MQSPIYKDKQEGKVGENVYLWNLEFGNIQSKECQWGVGVTGEQQERENR